MFALGKELKAENNIAKNQYQQLRFIFGFDKIIEKKNQHLKTIVN